MRSYKDIKKNLLKNKNIKKEYEKLDFEFGLIKEIIKKRNEQGITQKELALKLGTKQSSISRFESGTYSPSFSFVINVSQALGFRIKLL